MTTDEIVYEYESGHKTRQSKVTRVLHLVDAAGVDGMTA